MYDIVLIPFIIFCAFALLIFLGSILLPFMKLKGFLRFAIIIPILIFWKFVYWNTWGEGSQFAEIDWRAESTHICERETKLFPNWFYMDSFITDATNISTQAILSLLSNRGLNYIDIRVSKLGPQKFIAYGANQGDAFWETEATEGTYARVELGKKGDVGCTDLPYPVSGQESELPFLPDTCVRVTYSNNTTSRYALLLTPSHYSKHPSERKYGTWTLTDLEKGQQLATVTTSDKYGTLTGGVIANINRNDLTVSPGQDCRSSGYAIVNRMLAPEQSKSILREADAIMASPPKFDVDQDGITEVTASEQGIRNNDNNVHFDPINSHNSWTLAIEQAKKSGWGNYYNYLIDWRERTIKTFIPPKIDKSFWSVRSINDGFIAYTSTNNSWYEQDGGLILRYTSTGQLDWIARVIPPMMISGICQRFDPEAIYIEETDLILAHKCASDGSGVNWHIPLTALPGKI